jgi:hypothetical protein
MGLVTIPPEDLSRDDDPEGRAPPSHGPDFYRRGVGPQEKAVLEIKGVLHISRRMVRGDIKAFKVVEVVLDFRSVGN